MRVLVTGGTGYLGAAIVRALVRRGHEPRVFARHATASGLPGIPIDGDVRDRETFLRAAENTAAICHSAALVSIWRPRPRDFDEINVGGLQNAIDVARTRGVARLVYTSSFLARPPAGSSTSLDANDYQRTKVAAYQIARRAAAEGVPIVTLVPGVVYGPGSLTEGNLVGRLVRDHLAGKLPGVLGADRLWSFAWIHDVAEAHVTAIERARAGAELELGGENVPQMRLFEILRALSGRPLPRRLPFAVGTLAGLCEEWRVLALGGIPQITRGAVEIFRHDWPLDSSASTNELNYRITPLEDGVREMLEAMRS